MKLARWIRVTDIVGEYAMLSLAVLIGIAALGLSIVRFLIQFKLRHVVRLAFLGGLIAATYHTLDWLEVF